MRAPWWLLAFWLLPAPARADADLSLAVAAADTPLVVSGLLDGKTTTFSRSFEVTCETRGPPRKGLPLGFSRTDLQVAGDPTRRIDRADVLLPADAQLDTGVPAILRITVQNVIRPGDYDGALTLTVSGVRHTVPLKLSVAARAAIRPDAAATLQVVRSHWNVSELFDQIILPNHLTGQQLVTLFENTAPGTARATALRPVLKGEQTGAVLPLMEEAHAEVTMEPGKPASVIWSINRDQAIVDRYKGTVRIRLADSDEVVSTPAVVEVRNGPKGPLLCVLLGIVIGRSIRRRSTPEAQERERLLDRCAELLEQCRILRNVPARTAITASVVGIRREVQGGAPPAGIEDRLNVLARRIEQLLELDALEAALPADPQGDRTRQQVREQIAACRESVMNDAADLGARMEDVRQQVKAALGFQPPPMAPPARLYRKAEGSGAGKATTEWRQKLINFVGGVAGTSTAVIEQRPGAFLTRAALGLATLAALALIGFDTLYVKNGATFGAGSILDYMSLIIWGLSADVAQRTLQDLPGNSK